LFSNSSFNRLTSSITPLIGLCSIRISYWFT